MASVQSAYLYTGLLIYTTAGKLLLIDTPAVIIKLTVGKPLNLFRITNYKSVWYLESSMFCGYSGSCHKFRRYGLLVDRCAIDGIKSMTTLSFISTPNKISSSFSRFPCQQRVFVIIRKLLNVFKFVIYFYFC